MKTLAVALALLLTSGGQHRPIELRVSPQICQVPCDVRAIVRIEPHELNRWWALQIDGPIYIGGARQLEGNQAPPTQDAVWFKGLVPGDYIVTAVVYRQQAKSEAGRAQTRVMVIGG